MQMVYDAGIRTEFLPPVIFLGVGRLDRLPTAAGPAGSPSCWAPPRSWGSSPRRSVRSTSSATPSPSQQAASIGIIGGADGPTSIFLATQARAAPAGRHRRGRLQLHVAGAGHSAAHHATGSPPNKERAIDMRQTQPVSKTAVIIFPIATGSSRHWPFPRVRP